MFTSAANQPLWAEIDPGDHMQGRPVRVLVVDDNESVRRSICKLLHSQADIEVICEAVDGADAVEKAREHLPDLVLLDITMPTMSGLEAARILKRDFPSMHILIVSQHESRSVRGAALTAGASGYVVKSNVVQDLIPEVRRIQGLRMSA